MNRTHLEILTIMVVLATIVGLTIIGLILIARIPPYYLAVFMGLVLWAVVLTIAYIIPALKIIGVIGMLLIGAVTIGLFVRKAAADRGCIIATTVGLVGGVSFVFLMMIFNLLIAALL